MENNTITKSEITNHLHEEIGLNKKESKLLVEAFFQCITDKLAIGNDWYLQDFGTFHINDKASRVGRNPKTGEEAIIEARKTVSFKTDNNLKEKIRECKR